MSEPVKIVVFVILFTGLVAFIVGRVRGIYRTRRALWEAAATVPGTPTGEGIPSELRAAGFERAIRSGPFAGVTLTRDGVIIQALFAHETTPMGHSLPTTLTVWALGVLEPEAQWRPRVSAKPQGIRRAGGALVLGLPEVDGQLDVRGDAADARALFATNGAGALDHAIRVHGWRLAGGLLVRPPQGMNDLASTVQAGVAAAKVLAAAPRPDGALERHRA